MIAASATVNRLIAVTRNVRNFDQLGAPRLNPFAIREERGESARPDRASSFDPGTDG